MNDQPVVTRLPDSPNKWRVVFHVPGAIDPEAFKERMEQNHSPSLAYISPNAIETLQVQQTEKGLTVEAVFAFPLSVQRVDTIRTVPKDTKDDLLNVVRSSTWLFVDCLLEGVDMTKNDHVMLFVTHGGGTMAILVGGFGVMKRPAVIDAVRQYASNNEDSIQLTSNKSRVESLEKSMSFMVLEDINVITGETVYPIRLKEGGLSIEDMMKAWKFLQSQGSPEVPPPPPLSPQGEVPPPPLIKKTVPTNQTSEIKLDMARVQRALEGKASTIDDSIAREARALAARNAPARNAPAKKNDDGRDDENRKTTRSNARADEREHILRRLMGLVDEHDRDSNYDSEYSRYRRRHVPRWMRDVYGRRRVRRLRRRYDSDSDSDSPRKRGGLRFRSITFAPIKSWIPRRH